MKKYCKTCGSEALFKYCWNTRGGRLCNCVSSNVASDVNMHKDSPICSICSASPAIILCVTERLNICYACFLSGSCLSSGHNVSVIQFNSHSRCYAVPTPTLVRPMNLTGGVNTDQAGPSNPLQSSCPPLPSNIAQIANNLGYPGYPPTSGSGQRVFPSIFDSLANIPPRYLQPRGPYSISTPQQQVDRILILYFLVLRSSQAQPKTVRPTLQSSQAQPGISALVVRNSLHRPNLLTLLNLKWISLLALHLPSLLKLTRMILLRKGREKIDRSAFIKREG